MFAPNPIPTVSAASVKAAHAARACTRHAAAAACERRRITSIRSSGTAIRSRAVFAIVENSDCIVLRLHFRRDRYVCVVAQQVAQAFSGFGEPSPNGSVGNAQDLGYFVALEVVKI